MLFIASFHVMLVHSILYHHYFFTVEVSTCGRESRWKDEPIRGSQKTVRDKRHCTDPDFSYFLLYKLCWRQANFFLEHYLSKILKIHNIRKNNGKITRLDKFIIWFLLVLTCIMAYFLALSLWSYEMKKLRQRNHLIIVAIFFESFLSICCKKIQMTICLDTTWNE